MFEHFVESRIERRRRWPGIVVLASAACAALGVGVGVAMPSSASSPDGCEEAPVLSKLDPPRTRPALLAAPPPPPGWTHAGQAARKAGHTRETEEQDPNRERPEGARSSSPPVCDEESPRAQILAGDDLYRAGQYAEAVKTYEAALKEAPDLAIGHHNAGLAYIALFRADSEDPKAPIYAKKATWHLETYLDSSPDDHTIKSLVTKTWVDAELYDSAIRYWRQELDEAPENLAILGMLASISRKAGRFERAIEWYERRAEVADEAAAKVEALLEISELQLSRLRQPDLVGRARLEVADRGIEALQRAEKLAPDDLMIQSYLGSIYQLRARAHEDSALREADMAKARAHLETWAELRQR